MKKYFLLILFQSFFILSIGQVKQNYLLYFEKIREIEYQSSKENFIEALELYSELFKSYRFVFARDAYNACQIAALKKNKNFKYFLFFCAKAGIGKEVLLKNMLIKKQYNLDSTKYESIFIIGRKEYLSLMNLPLRKEFKYRYELEQNNKSKPDFKEICKANFNRILSLAKKDSFPGEQLIGVNDDCTNSYVITTLLHYPDSYKILSSYLWEAVKSGETQPYPVIYVYSFNQTRVCNRYFPIDSVNFKTCYNFSFGKISHNIDEVNKQRNLKNILSIEAEQSLISVAKKYHLNYKFGY